MCFCYSMMSVLFSTTVHGLVVCFCEAVLFECLEVGKMAMENLTRQNDNICENIIVFFFHR